MTADLPREERGLHLGGGLGANDDSESVWRLFGGYRAHRNLAVSRNLGVRLEWQRYTDFGGGGFGGVSDQDVISVNAIYRFR
jgi:hypothetical protein